jgi:glycosyltransferase involved in cell wall biosynthesis
MDLADFEVIRAEQRQLLPQHWFGLGPLINRYVAPLPGIRQLCLRTYLVGRPLRLFPDRKLSASILIPCRNERGNIEPAIRRLPAMAERMEVIFVEGHSRDDTLAEIRRVAAAHPEVDIKVLVQDGVGKADAVFKGFDQASGDVLMILDADMTVPPEDLPRFYHALVSGRGDFINGVRLVYPMERRAMRFLNLVGNKFFSMAFSWLLGQPVKDTLCGTKVLWRRDYELIAANRHYFGEFDPFGDFDLLFGAAKLCAKLVDMPIRYRERTYGSTNIQRWKHGWLLLRMVAFAARRIKFV